MSQNLATSAAHRFTPNAFVAEIPRAYAARFFHATATSSNPTSSALDFDPSMLCEEAVSDLRGLLREAFARVSITNPLGLDVSRSILESRPFTGEEEEQHDDKTSAGTRRRDQFQRFHIFIVDTRVASALYYILLRAQVVPLQNMRLLLPHGGAILELPDHNKMNFDSELWEQANKKLANVLKSSQSSSSSSSGQNNVDSSSFSIHLKDVSTIAHISQWAAKNVLHCGVFELDGSSSPLAMALLILHRIIHPSLADLVQLAKHHNRCVRCVALFYARYTSPPEELLPVFISSMNDQTLISTSAEGHDTVSLKNLCRQLLTEDEVFEAWLPQYPPSVLEKLIPALLTEAERLGSLRQPAAMATGTADPAASNGDSLMIRGDDPALAAGGSAVASSPLGKKLPPQSTSSLAAAAAADAARGHGSLPGFKSLRAFRETFAARRRHTLREMYDVGFGEDDEEAEYRRAQAQSAVGAAEGHDTAAANDSNNKKRLRAEEDGGGDSSAINQPNAPSATVDTQKMALTHGSKVLLKLLGRSAPFRKDDPVYLEF